MQTAGPPCASERRAVPSEIKGGAFFSLSVHVTGWNRPAQPVTKLHRLAIVPHREAHARARLLNRSACWGPLRARCGKTGTCRRIHGRVPRPASFCASRRFDERRARLLGMRKALLAALLAASLADPALAQLAVNIVVAPPAPLSEPVPAPRPGFVWAPGYWVWWGNRYVWWRGYWMPARAGWVWHRGWWAHNGPSWRWHPGWWARA
jgi:hypothetical protein